LTILRAQLHEDTSLRGWGWRGAPPVAIPGGWRAVLPVDSGQVRSMHQLKPSPTDPYDTRGDVWRAELGREYWIRTTMHVPADMLPITYSGGKFAPPTGSGGGLWWQWQASPDDGEQYRSPIMGLYLEGREKMAQHLGGALHTPTASNPYLMLWLRGDTQAARTDTGFTHSWTRLLAPLAEYIGRDVTLRVHVLWHWRASEGPFVEAWLDDRQVVWATGDPDGYDTLGQPNASNDARGPYHSQGVYVWDWDSTTNQAACDIDAWAMEFRETIIADSRADVWPGETARQAAIAARWNVEEAVREIEAEIARHRAAIPALEATRDRLLTEAVPRLYRLEGV
jgi:hypothetical protein